MPTLLTVRAEWPLPEDQGESPFVVEIVPKREASERGTPRPAHSERFVLPLASHLLNAGAGVAYADGYAVFCERQIGVADPETGLTSLNGVRNILQQLCHGANGIEYPVTAWLLPHGIAEAFLAMRNSNRFPHDRLAFRSALQTGAVWLSIADIVIDIITSRKHASHLVRWLQSASSGADILVDWDFWSSTFS